MSTPHFKPRHHELVPGVNPSRAERHRAQAHPVVLLQVPGGDRPVERRAEPSLTDVPREIHRHVRVLLRRVDPISERYLLSPLTHDPGRGGRGSIPHIPKRLAGRSRLYRRLR